MLKDLIKEGGLYAAAHLITKGFSLLLIPFYADYFTQSEYGILAMLGIAGAISAAVFSFQIYQGVGRYIAEPNLTKREQQAIASTGLWFTIFSYAAFVLLGFLFKDIVISLLSEDQRILDTTYIWCLFAIGANGIFYTLNVQLKFMRKIKEFSLTSFLHAILNIGFILLFALGLDYRIDSVYMATLVVTPLLILLQLYYLKGHLIFYFGKKELKKLFTFSSPLILASVAYLILNFTDRIFIKEISGALSEVGIYDMAFKFSGVVSLIIVSFQSALAPIVYEKHQLDSTPFEMGTVLRLFFGLGTLGVLILSFFSYETLYIFTTPAYYEASSFMPLFYLTVLMTGLGMFSIGLHLKNRTKMIPFIVAGTALLNVILNYLLIPIYGLMGAALATLIATFFNNFILFYLSQKLYKIPFDTGEFMKLSAVFLLLMFGGGYFILLDKWEYVWLFGFKIAGITIYLLLLIQLKIIRLDQILNFLKAKKSD